ncbi:F0F1 ATP synthase subunit B [Thermosulfurimonas sp. F29]|uniref:F0F1 ATP synthase subunit B n=1 Tax=Thermosulfurimonas sp. F29 TaxID=2867247 RepID=UPI001C82DF8E|nr:F0F1 ATP synthase subunit B [Thermosulfurimonas sp. F29]MBX6422676.1 F0F1 ATP synthase subunit B [Thermosulfurimonas sp. F29]
MRKWVGVLGLGLLVAVVWCVLGLAAGETLMHGASAPHEAAVHAGVTREQLTNFIWWLVNFLLLVAILYKFGKDPIVNMFRSRREAILNEYEDLMAKKREAEQRYAELQEKLKGLEAEAQRLLESFREQGEHEAQRIVEEARKNAERIKQQAELYIQQELARARAELQREVAELAVKMAEEILRKNITEEDQRRLFEEFVEKIETVERVVH